MITQPMDVLEKYEIRKTKKQKTAFISAISSYAERQHYTVRVETGKMGCRNIVIGDPQRADYLLTAHYDTPASIGLPNFITPCNAAAFIVFQVLMLGFFFLIAFVAGLITSFITQDEGIIFAVAYFAYMGLLLLMMVGPANRHTANDNTSGVVTVLETMSTMPENLRDRVCFVLFDLEEAGLIGSASYRKTHKKETDRQMVLNLDCVGDGNEILLFPMKALKKNRIKMKKLQSITGKYGKKSISIRKQGFAYYPSDQKHFPYGVGIAAFRRAKGIGLYCGRIHTWRDTVLEQTNVNILRAALTSLIGAAEE
jgi:hypothetical protein